MNLKKMWKRFWNLNVHNHEGFTLVELIIVIAILAILSSVAVVGYSSYVTKANKQADLTLAADIENALMLAFYSDGLTPGDYIVIKFDGTATWGNDSDTTANTIYAAMAAAYGDGWENTLKLKWNGWADEIGVAGDAFMMGCVNSSTFNADDENIDVLLAQVQHLVGVVSTIQEGQPISKNMAELLQSYGIDVVAGEKYDAETAMAVSNALVFQVAEEMAGMNVDMDQEDTSFIEFWMSGEKTEGSEMTVASEAAAKYARVYALALYIDGKAGTEFAKDMKAENAPDDVAKRVLEKIENSTDDDVQAAYSAYYLPETEGGVPRAYNDAAAFIAYMQGVTSSSDSLRENTDIKSKEYYYSEDGGGYVSDYVKNYVAMSNVLTNPQLNVSGSAFVFMYTGNGIVCMPLDY